MASTGTGTQRTLDPDRVVTWLASTFARRNGDGVLVGVGEDDCGVIRIGETIAVLSTDFINATPIETSNLLSQCHVGRFHKSKHLGLLRLER